MGIRGAVDLLPAGQPRSVRAVTTRSWPPQRFGSVPHLRQMADVAEAGQLLDEAGTGSVWPALNTADVLDSLRLRVLNPTVMYQASTMFCGPTSAVFELARREPARYVAIALALLHEGKFTSNDRVLQTTGHLRTQPLPEGLDAADWLVPASLRDDENWLVPIDEGDSWVSGLSTFGEERGWQRDVLLDANASWELCWFNGEADALRSAVQSRSSGGSGFLCIDSNLIRDGKDDHEEDVSWSLDVVNPDGHRATLQTAHSKDDGSFCDHWVVLCNAAMPPGVDDNDDDTVVLEIWSWGRLYTLTGSMDAISEYLYGVAVGTPAQG